MRTLQTLGPPGSQSCVLSYRFTWTKDGKPFDVSDPRVIISNSSGTFRIPNEGQLAHFQGKYRCFASNNLGVAMSEEIEFIVPSKCDSGDCVYTCFRKVFVGLSGAQMQQHVISLIRSHVPYISLVWGRLLHVLVFRRG